jgi:hypothetical protein
MHRRVVDDNSQLHLQLRDSNSRKSIYANTFKAIFKPRYPASFIVSLDFPSVVIQYLQKGPGDRSYHVIQAVNQIWLAESLVPAGMSLGFL